MKLRHFVINVVASLAVISLVALYARAANSQSPCSAISPQDAQILIYLLPVADQLRKEGMDIAWERVPLAEAHSSTEYVFWVYNSKREGTASVTIGYYRVNRCTGVITEDETGKAVTSQVLDRVRSIMLDGHKT